MSLRRAGALAWYVAGAYAVCLSCVYTRADGAIGDLHNLHTQTACHCHFFLSLWSSLRWGLGLVLGHC